MAHAIQPALFGEAPSVVPQQRRRKKPSKVRTVEAVCTTCLEPFTYRKVRRAQGFCSELCRQIRFRYNRIIAHRCCRHCGNWFPTEFRNSVYCGTKCLGAASALKARKGLTCKGCGKTFTVRDHEIRVFCSPTCRYTEEYPRNCSGCGTEFTTASPRQKWCVECEGTYRRDQLRRVAREGWDRLDYELRNAYTNLIRVQPCTYCGCQPGAQKIHIDHAIPLSRGGSDAWHNLVPACESCNLRKHAKTPEEFLASLGR